LVATGTLSGSTTQSSALSPTSTAPRVVEIITTSELASSSRFESSLQP